MTIDSNRIKTDKDTVCLSLAPPLLPHSRRSCRPPPPCETKLTTPVQTKSTAFTLNTLNCTGKNRKDRNCKGINAELVATDAFRVGTYTFLRFGRTCLLRECPSMRPVAMMPVPTKMPSRKTESATTWARAAKEEETGRRDSKRS